MTDKEVQKIAEGLSENELRNLIRSKIGFHNGERVFAQQLAEEYGVSKAYLSDVLNGRRGIADKLAGALGFRRVVTFVPKENEGG